MARFAALLFALSFVSFSVLASGRGQEAVDRDPPAVPLTTEKVQKVTEVMRSFNQKLKADPRLARQIYGTSEPSEKNDAEFSIDARVERHPVFQKALASAGLDSAAFKRISASILAAQFAMAARASGEKISLDKVTAANATWIQQHRQEVQRFADELGENVRLSENAESPAPSAEQEEKPSKEK